MATALTLFCLVIDNRKVPIGDIFDVEVQSNDLVTKLRKVIKTEMAPRLDNLAADRLTVWKLLTPPDIESIEDEDSFDKTIQDFVLPRPKSKEAFQGNSDVQALRTAKELSAYWENSPEKGHLHILVQVPFVVLSNLPALLLAFHPQKMPF
ncbi:hypothetical protein B0F90DRAFT_440851 [Multifurca ochricompacta]|uniref:Crinkler effector protein N-terminal domain-containing protein n=1 Tax=Multifurca ochricompacta TaxID=376703 RepID=A0AAD4LUC5_9AGAM|nr:hypothetical protein B0F90DRAFT_440851 [Multifurca ochricompacta]